MNHDCPSCGKVFGYDARFCPSCGLRDPLEKLMSLEARRRAEAWEQARVAHELEMDRTDPEWRERVRAQHQAVEQARNKAKRGPWILLAVCLGWYPALPICAGIVGLVLQGAGVDLKSAEFEHVAVALFGSGALALGLLLAAFAVRVKVLLRRAEVNGYPLIAVIAVLNILFLLVMGAGLLVKAAQ